MKTWSDSTDGEVFQTVDCILERGVRSGSGQGSEDRNDGTQKEREKIMGIAFEKHLTWQLYYVAVL